MAWEARSGLKQHSHQHGGLPELWLNGLGSPFGIETEILCIGREKILMAKWPGKPVRD